MGNNKFFKILLIILISLTLGGVLALVFVNTFNKDPNAAPTIEEVVANSYMTEEITTNLLSNDFIRASFQLQADSKAAAEEVAKRDFQVNNIIIRTLAGMEASELSGPEGIEKLEATIRDEINELMQDGKVVRVYTTSWVIQ